jgi:hypothetical protein
VDTFLTLVIALGGIATGIGAIWAAMVARRQAQVTARSLDEQRQSFQEQTEIVRRQAELTEQSLAQTERSLAEQNERSRLNLEVDLLTRMEHRFESPHLLRRRRAAAGYLLDNVFVDGDMVEVERLNRAVLDVCNFFELLGYLQRLGALQAGSVWNSFGVMSQAYWLLCKPALEKRREERADPTLYEDFERLNRLGTDLARERGIAAHPQEWLRRIMTDEAVIGEEPPTATD